MKMTNAHVMWGMLLAAIGLVVVVGYTLFSASGTNAAGRAVPELTVGNLKAKFVPYPAMPGLETVTFTYSGAGEFDISGWELQNESGVVATVPQDTVLTDGDEILLCAALSTLVGCVTAWTGDVWSDESGAFYFRAPGASTQFISFSYANNEDSVVLVPQREIVAPVYAAQDQVPVCHEFKNGSYKLQKDKTDRIVDGVRGHVSHDRDVIAPFFYTLGNGIQYFRGIGIEVSGVNPENGCA